MTVTIVIIAIMAIKSYALQNEEPAPKNLKVLPKNTSGEEVKNVMKVFTKSLGVKCGHCHVNTPQEGKPYPKFDFASDDKTEKLVARKMMVMVDSINTAFMSKMGEEMDFEKVTCVTCHMGNVKPMTSVDSLMKK
jgi:hypothetical protein